MQAQSKVSVAAATVFAMFAGCGGDARNVMDGSPSVGAGPDAGALGLDASLRDATLDDAAPLDAGDGQVAVRVRFKAVVGSAELVCGQSYMGLGSTRLAAKPQDFRFLVQDVRLLTRAGAEVPLALDERAPFQNKDVALLDFTDGTGSCLTGGPDTNMVITGRAPPGDYVGIAFSNGVPESLNHADPALAPAPLRAPGLSWDWLQGYRFFLAELNLPSGTVAAPLDGGAQTDAAAGQDTDAGSDAGLTSSGTSNGGGGHRGGDPASSSVAALHIGSTGCLGGIAVGINCTKQNRNQVRLTGFDPTSGSVLADLAAVFADVDLGREAVCHARGEQCAPMFSAVGVDLETGSPLMTQRVFRAE